MGKQDKKAGGAKGDSATSDATQADIKKYTEVIEELSKQAPIQVAPYVKKAAPYLATALVYFMIALPHIVQALTKAQEFINQVPEKILYASLGFAVCFFGGVFPATIAAVEAWRLCGGKEAWAHIKALHQEWLKVQAAHKEDEEKDKDKD